MPRVLSAILLLACALTRAGHAVPVPNVLERGLGDAGGGPFVGSGCVARPPEYRPQCCADKVAADIYDPICIKTSDCASWPPAHQQQCCSAKVEAKDYADDSVCLTILPCSTWADATDEFDSCCDRKVTAHTYDAACPTGWGNACSSNPREERGICCGEKVAAGVYDPACTMDADCFSWPAQHRKECCDAKGTAAGDDPACAVPEDCADAKPENLQYCCDVKDAAHTYDPACINSCSSDFFSLPRASYQSTQYFLGYSSDTAQSVAAKFCTDKGYSTAGAVANLTMPDYLQSITSLWRTYNPETEDACEGATCNAFGVIECVKKGTTRLDKDAMGNIGCSNAGSYNIGSGNSGSNNTGNGNSGSWIYGDGNSGSWNVGYHNRFSGWFGARDLLWSW